jgi:hypothetical protein
VSHVLEPCGPNLLTPAPPAAGLPVPRVLAARPQTTETFTPKLQYLPVRGRAEKIRLALEYGGVQYEDVRNPYVPATFGLLAVLPFGQLPALELDASGRLITQSDAILMWACACFPSCPPIGCPSRPGLAGPGMAAACRPVAARSEVNQHGSGPRPPSRLRCRCRVCCRLQTAVTLHWLGRGTGRGEGATLLSANRGAPGALRSAPLSARSSGCLNLPARLCQSWHAPHRGRLCARDVVHPYRVARQSGWLRRRCSHVFAQVRRQAWSWRTPWKSCRCEAARTPLGAGAVVTCRWSQNARCCLCSTALRVWLASCSTLPRVWSGECT